MPICCAFGCSNKPGNCWNSFHAFPFSRPNICQVWISNVRREKWKPNKRTLLCSDHFEDNCFVRTGKLDRLRPDAVPTKFSYPERLRKVNRERPPPKARADPQPESSSHADKGHVESEHAVAIVPNKIIEATDHDHDYCSINRKQQDTINRIRQKHRDVLKKLKLAKQSSKRMLRRVNSLQEVVDDLKSKFVLSANCESMLQKTYGDVLGGIIQRRQRNSKISGKSKRSYTPAMRSFALTLQFYSSKAYNYVRKSFDLCLPHPSTLRKWYSSVDAEPGFCEEAFVALKMKAEASTPPLCAMMLDEMAIRKHVEWDGRRFRGYVDIGVDIDDDDVPVATDALVLMVVAVNDSWKVPIAYFLVAGLSGEERANLVRQALLKLSEIGVTVISLTSDGPSCHFSMAHALGATLNLPDPVPSFPHPGNPEHKVRFILDICHMMKLLRNALAHLGIFIDGCGAQINWKYIDYLHQLQEKEGLRAGNKLRSAHIHWRKQPMKVHLAVQTISSSVADAIEFCNKDLGLPQFAGSEATVKFLRTFDRLFDLLNSRNPLAKGFKAAMKPSNQHWWKPFMEEACSYIVQLTDKNGLPLYKSKRKTAFVGFYISTLSILEIYHEFVSQAKLKYLLTYKFSQDHLELFFSAIRSRGGRNNNPTAAQFKAAFKRLLVRHEVKCATGNVTAQDNTKILHVLRDSETGVKDPLDIVDISLIRLYDLTPTLDYEDSHHDFPLLDFERLSRYSENVVSYIAGFVVRMVKARIHCHDCISALEPEISESSHRPLHLIRRKTRGGLLTASAGVEFVCRSTERCVRLLMKGRTGIPNQPALVSSICLTVLKDTCTHTFPIFPSLAEHMLDTAPDQNHVYRLISVICTCYLQIRLHHIGRSQTERITGAPVRRKLTKLVLFKHQ